MRQIVEVARALSDANRVRVLVFLARGEMCLCEIIEMLGLAPSTVSKHMAVLRQAGLVQVRKEGRWVYYRLPGRRAPRQVLQALRWVRDSLRGDPQAMKDARRLESVRKMSKERLCARYRK
jgi:DNA-binding transcriptional ArsR family regulator